MSNNTHTGWNVLGVFAADAEFGMTELQLHAVGSFATYEEAFDAAGAWREENPDSAWVEVNAAHDDADAIFLERLAKHRERRRASL